jgi:hypothetical protein
MLRAFERSVASSLCAGPLTLLLFLRIAKLTHEQKEERKAAKTDHAQSGYLDMQDLCFTDCTKDAGNTINRVLTFYSAQVQAWESSQSSLAARKLEKLVKEVLPSASSLKSYVKL